MSSFGDLLRKYRQGCKDPISTKQLSQDRLGELLGNELGMQGGYTGAAVSDWERGKSKVHADERRILVGLVSVLYKCGGLETVFEADKLLEAGNYKALDFTEKQSVFPEETINSQTNSPGEQKRPELLELLAEKVFYGQNNFKARLAKGYTGPLPHWLHKILLLGNTFIDEWSTTRTLPRSGWALTFALGWLVMPCMRWPFLDQAQAADAMAMYAGATLTIPLCIGALANTKNNQFWQERELGTNKMTRLYTYQGAGIGFHLSFFAILIINLVTYYAGVRSNVVIETLEIIILLGVSYGYARLVPRNLWLANKGLRLVNRGTFIVLLILGPIWGVYFYTYHLFFLDPSTGSFMILFIFGLIILVGKRRGS